MKTDNHEQVSTIEKVVASKVKSSQSTTSEFQRKNLHPTRGVMPETTKTTQINPWSHK